MTKIDAASSRSALKVGDVSWTEFKYVEERLRTECRKMARSILRRAARESDEFAIVWASTVPYVIGARPLRPYPPPVAKPRRVARGSPEAHLCGDIVEIVAHPVCRCPSGWFLSDADMTWSGKTIHAPRCWKRRKAKRK